MPDATPNSKGPAPIQGTPQTTEPAPIPADQVKPEDIGTLSIEYRDGQPVIVVSGGKYIPAGLTVVDAGGHAVGLFSAGPLPSDAQAKLLRPAMVVVSKIPVPVTPSIDEQA
ncbi:hypothetical protein [Streptomyces sp. NPDC056069]|uniref:hypothetical protein n=1 Tax=Streptomyces sp. NPDC056069 TaxID=3345702 RepID=UPI0035DA84D4